MNLPIRRLATLAAIMFLALLISVTMIQFVKAPELSADSRNVRTIYEEYGRERGPIIVADKTIVTSEPVDNLYSFLRTYEQGELYAHSTGYFSVAFNSMTGVERYENSVLGGSDTSLAIQRLRDLITGDEQRGGGVELTLDPEIQQAAVDALAGQKGSIVVLEPDTGRILAMVSIPSYDPNLLATHNSADAQANYDALIANPDQPLLNRATGGNLYAPGSVYKIVTATAMLESGADMDDEIEAPTEYSPPGTTHVIHNPGEAACGDGSGEATLLQSIRQSCNTPFAIAAVELGEDTMREQAERFGFGQSLSIPMPVTPSQFPDSQTQAELAQVGFGQYELKVSPMQMAMVASSIANDGSLMAPYLVDRTLSADLDEISTTSPSEFSRPMSEDTAEQLTTMMVDVVDNGTGFRAQIQGVDVAGKTGTAEISNTIAPHAWFIGFAPADNPEVAIAVLVENGGNQGFGTDGGSLAAPMAQSVLLTALND